MAEPIAGAPDMAVPTCCGVEPIASRIDGRRVLTDLQWFISNGQHRLLGFTEFFKFS